MTSIGILLFFTILSARAQSTRLDDDSDWWSLVRDDTVPAGAAVQKRHVAGTTFDIAGIVLGRGSDERSIVQRFGKVTQIDRGDASSGRHQACYASPARSNYLIFEWDEVESVAYLIKNAKPWHGQEFCAMSALVTEQLATRSGLTLGISRQRVFKLLGSPSLATPGRLYYFFEYEQKPSTAEIRKLRKENPQMSEDEFAKNFSSLTVTAVVDARFRSGALTYLAISRSEVY